MSVFQEESGNEDNFSINSIFSKVIQDKSSKKTLEQELESAWDYVQNKLLCYELPYPDIKADCETKTACIDMGTHEITINKNFIDYLHERGVSHETILKGILSHEAGHYKIIPWDLKNLLLMIHTAEKTSGKNKSQIITNYFADISLNLDLVLTKREESVREIYGAMGKDSKIDLLLGNLYSIKTGMDFNVPPITPELRSKLKSLAAIKFTNHKKLYSNLEKFAKIVQDLIDEDKNKECVAKDGCANNHGDNDYAISEFDNLILDGVSEADLNKALKDIAADCCSPRKYKDVYNTIKGLSGKNTATADKKKNTHIHVFGLSNILSGRDASDSLVSFYTSKADAYHVSVENRDVFGGGNASMSELKAWNIDESPASVDIFNSYGRFFPTISKSWVESGEDGSRKTIATPDLVIMIDSSGSMVDPEDSLSCAALGALCAAKEYLTKQRLVAVVNFGDITKVTDFSKDYKSIAKALLHYQNGGTELITKQAFDLVAKSNGEVDILMISDGFISNFERVMKKFNSYANTNRITVLEVDRMGMGGFSTGLEKKYHKMKIYPVRNEQDIPGLVLGELKNNGVI